VITTYAGSEDPDRSCNSGIGDSGNASDAGFHSIECMAFDSHDNLYVATSNNDIRRIDHASTSSTARPAASGTWATSTA
jgi:hypothetical protein